RRKGGPSQVKLIAIWWCWPYASSSVSSDGTSRACPAPRAAGVARARAWRVSVPPRAGASLRRGRARGQIRRRRLGARLLEALDDDRVQLRVHALDARDGRVDQLARARLALADQLGLRGGSRRASSSLIGRRYANRRPEV